MGKIADWLALACHSAGRLETNAARMRTHGAIGIAAHNDCLPEIMDEVGFRKSN